MKNISKMTYKGKNLTRTDEWGRPCSFPHEIP